MSDSYHVLHEPFIQLAVQYTGIVISTYRHAAEWQTLSRKTAAQSPGLPAYAIIDWSEGREGREAARPANLPTYAKQRQRCIDTMQDKPRKNHAKSEDIMSTPLRKGGRYVPLGKGI